MAVDMFLKIEGPIIDGESQDSTHKGEIDILAWSWGATQSGTTHLGSGGGAGKANVDDLSFTHYVDSASHNLMQHCFNGKHIEKVTLVVRKAGGTPLEYITIVMEDVIITSISTGGSGGEDRLTENVTMNFSKVNFTYKPQDAKGGAGADKLAGWDIAENKSTV